METDSRRVIQELSAAPVRNVGAIGFFSNYPVERFYREGDSLLVTGRSDELWGYLSGNSKNELGALVKRARPDISCFACIEQWMRPIVVMRRPVISELTTMRLYYPPTRPLPEGPFYTEQLCAQDIPAVCGYSHYAAYISRSYIEDRISRGFSACVRKNGQLVAWGLTHDEDSIGNLHVLPEWRRHGYGRRIVASLMAQIREAGRIPVMNVEPSNTASLELARSLGFQEDRLIGWVKLAKTVPESTVSREG